METRPALLHLEQKILERPWLEAAVAALDERLRLRHGVVEYTNCSSCLFRMQLITSDVDLVLSDGVRVRVGDRVINLHIWNEQFPSFPPQGPTLAWARHVTSCFDASLRELARYIALRSDLDDVVAICGKMCLGPERSAQLARFVARFGFEECAAPQDVSVRERVHRFGENILISMMIMARNAGAMRVDTLWRDRKLVFLSRRTLLCRYGSGR